MALKEKLRPRPRPVGLCYASAAYFSKQLKCIARISDLRDENGTVIPLAFGQGRDTGLTRRSVQGANNMAITKLGGWASPTPPIATLRTR
ncbi:hypothetical protein [Spirosoma endophyticum]|uniref:hypothetical protein n=1 Tax=Spirosoma endophyticum TaxID=662367 RepID=UPI0011603689|nr:hypothetical protein [Spirosoma endophyticum]